MLEINNNYTVQDLKKACDQKDSKKVCSIYNKILRTENEVELLETMFLYTFRKGNDPSIYHLFLRKYLEKAVNLNNIEKNLLISHVFQQKTLLQQLKHEQVQDILNALKKICPDESKEKLTEIKKELEKFSKQENLYSEKKSTQKNKEKSKKDSSISSKEELSDQAKKQLENKNIEIKEKTKKLENQEKEISSLKQKISNLDSDINFKNTIISKLTYELKKQENINLKNIEEFQSKEAYLNKIIQQREEDIKVLQTQKDDKKVNFINSLENKLKIRFKDFKAFQDIENSKEKAESMEITLEKVFEILKNEGINL